MGREAAQLLARLMLGLDVAQCVDAADKCPVVIEHGASHHAHPAPGSVGTTEARFGSAAVLAEGELVADEASRRGDV